MTPRPRPATAPVPPAPDDPFADLSPADRAEIEAAAIVTPEDADDALLQWRAGAPPATRDLLDATPFLRPLR